MESNELSQDEETVSAQPDNFTETDAAFENESGGDASEQSYDEQLSPDPGKDDTSIIKTRGGSDKFLLKLDGNKPGLYVRVRKEGRKENSDL